MKNYKEELTADQHDEFTVDSDTDSDHVWQSAKRAVDLGVMSIREAAKAYGLSEASLSIFVGE